VLVSLCARATKALERCKELQDENIRLGRSQAQMNRKMEELETEIASKNKNRSMKWTQTDIRKEIVKETKEKWTQVTSGPVRQEKGIQTLPVDSTVMMETEVETTEVEEQRQVPAMSKKLDEILRRIANLEKKEDKKKNETPSLDRSPK